MKIATWNVNSLNVRLAQVLQWLASNPIDVLCLQETKLVDGKFPHAAFAEIGYQAQCFGQPTYNGVAILSKLAQSDTTRNMSNFEDPQCRLIASLVGQDQEAIRVVGAYFPNGQSVDSDKFVYKLRWLDALKVWLAAELKRYPKLVLVGDFNIAPHDQDVHEPELWRDQVLCTDEERSRFNSLLGLGMCDAFRLFKDQPEKSFTWWDYRMMAFRRNLGLRIDHILVSDPLVAQVQSCTIDKTPRKNERPSDHAPVVVEL